MDWLGDNAWAVWTALAVGLGIAELLSLDLILLMLAVGAVGGVVAAVVGLPVAIQALAFAAVSVAMIALVRPGVVARLHDGPSLVLGHDKLVGRQGVVVTEITDQGGQVRIDGDLWSARAYDDSQTIPAGARVDVFAIRGATAVVHQIPELES